MACLVAALVDLMMEKVEGEVVAVMEDSVPVEASEPWLINGDPSHRYPQPYVSYACGSRNIWGTPSSLVTHHSKNLHHPYLGR